MSKKEVKRTTCYGCPVAACFIQAHLEDGKLVKVTPDPELPCASNCTRGFLDSGGKRAIEFHNMESRINYPMKRAGERGENKWQRISWDQALDEIAEKLEGLKAKYGPHCMSVNTGTAHHSDNAWVPYRFHAGFGSINLMGHEQVCYGCQMNTMEQTFGWVASFFPNPNYPPQSMIVVGNYSESTPHAFAAILQLVQSGMKLIVIDPCLTDTTQLADVWVQGRPGSDIALFMCWIREMIKNEWYDKEFVTDWSNGPFLVRTSNGKMLAGSDLKAGLDEDAFVCWDLKTKAPVIWDGETRTFAEPDVEQALRGTFTITLADGQKVECKTAFDMLAERVEEWTPEKTSEVTWIPVPKIMAGIETYATNKPNAIMCTSHAYDAYAPGSSAVYRCKDIMRILSGSIDRSEFLSGMFDTDKMWSIYEMELKPDEFFSAEDKKKQIGSERFKGLSFDLYDMKAKYAKKIFGPGAVSNAHWSCQIHAPTAWQDIEDDKPDRLRAIIMSGSNPVIKYNNTKRVVEVLKKLELVVANEFVMTSSAQLADYVLPMSDWFERPEIGPTLPSDMFNILHMGAAVVEPQFERRSDYDMFRGLAIRLGFGDLFKWETLTDCYNDRCKGLLDEYGCKDIEEFTQKYGGEWPEHTYEAFKLRNGFATPTGRTELHSVMLERLECDPLPKYYEQSISPYSQPELAKEYPLILIGVDRHMPFYHTMYFGVPSLRSMCPDPFFMIHPDTARRMHPSITDGDWVWIETPKGRIKQRARLTSGIHPRAIKIQHHWWFPEQPGEYPCLHGVFQSNTNVLTDDDPDLCDPVFGSWPHTAVLCKIYKEADGEHLEDGKLMY